MPSTTQKRRWTEDGMKGRLPKKSKKVKKQKVYHSSSEDTDSEPEGVASDAPVDFKPVSLESSDEEEDSKPKPKPKSILKASSKSTISQPIPNAEAVEKDSEEESEEGSENEAKDEYEAAESESNDLDGDSEASISDTSTNNPARKVRKRNDPDAFATSISKILNSKLTTKNRSEPILARSKAAHDTNQALADHKLTLKAHRAVLAEKKASQDRGRVKDVLGLKSLDVSTAEIVAEEKKLRRTAQKGVIKLFNAVRAAQVKAEVAQRAAQKEGMVGMDKREEIVQEMSKQGFLDMIAGGGSKKEGGVAI